MFAHVIAPNLELRPYEERFAQEIYEVTIASREHLRPFMGWVEKVNSVDDTRKFIRDSMEAMVASKGFQAGIWENGHYIGGLGFHHIDWIRRYGELGYWLAPEAQGRGIMTKACRALIAHAFDGMKLNRVEIRCDLDNARSRAIPLRLGFKEEGVLRESLPRFDGVMRDAVVYGILASEWK